MSAAAEAEPFQLNAWTGRGAAGGKLVARPGAWMAAHRPVSADEQGAGASSFYPEFKPYRSLAEGGWGVILPALKDAPDAQQARADDAPEPIQQLVRSRQGRVLRYRPEHPLRFSTLYDPAQSLPFAIGQGGDEEDRLPAYLLIYGSPQAIPWQLQFALNSVPARYVGRLDLTGEALENYVGALLGGWKDAQIQRDAPLIWATDHGAPDITSLMRSAIAERLARRYLADKDLAGGTLFLDGRQGQGSARDLIAALGQRRPGVVVTTSHGQTGATAKHTLAEQLGWLVDQRGNPIDPGALLDAWQPDGAIWYAHACCSAGSLAPSAFRKLVQPSTRAGRVLKELAALPDGVAPLPQALLGAKRPLRAFIGHVEPTFSYTLQQAGTKQYLSGGIIEMLNQRAYDPACYPVGFMAQGMYLQLANLASQHSLQLDDGDERGALYYQICFRDVQSMVILGDPSVTLPPPAPPSGAAHRA